MSRASAQQLFELLPGKTAELAAWSGPVEGGDFERAGGEGARLAVGDGRGERVYREAETVLEGDGVVVALLQLGGDGLGVAAHHDETLFVGDAAVVGEAV